MRDGEKMEVGESEEVREGMGIGMSGKGRGKECKGQPFVIVNVQDLYSYAVLGKICSIILYIVTNTYM